MHIIIIVIISHSTVSMPYLHFSREEKGGHCYNTHAKNALGDKEKQEENLTLILLNTKYTMYR